MNVETTLILEAINRLSDTLDALLAVGCLIFGSLLFVHFGRFMRW